MIIAGFVTEMRKIMIRVMRKMRRSKQQLLSLVREPCLLVAHQFLQCGLPSPDNQQWGIWWWGGWWWWGRVHFGWANIESETKQQKPKSEGMASNIAEIINAVHGVHCHQCYDLSISYHQCHKVTKSLNRYPCICLYLCVCACFCLLSSPLINCWKKSQLCGIPLKCFHGSDYSWTSWSTVNVTNRVVLDS